MRSTRAVALAATAATSLALVATSALTAQSAPTVIDATVATTAITAKAAQTTKSAQTTKAVQAAKAAKTASAGTKVRVATFNVRTSRADRGTSRHWLRRVLSVAREIKSRNPDIVAIQELGPGRADGKKAKIKNAKRQTESLVAALRSVGASQYKLTRTTSYIKPGTTHGTQGARILYNKKQVSAGQPLPRDHRQEELQLDLLRRSADPER